jgi:hypothetical protein
MKTISVLKKIWVLLLIIPAVFMAGCSKNFDVPPVEIPNFVLPAGASIISIDSLKSRHTVVGDLDSINDDIYVTGIVVSNDKTGNIYKSLYIQDTTGGLLISLDATSLYNTYAPGQRIYVKCKGLFLGDYNVMTQLGMPYAGEIGRIPAPLISQYLFLHGLPGPLPEAKLVTIATITPKDLGMLIKLENVHFEEVGSPFADATASTNRTISDGTSALIMRNSNYATFRKTLLPEGNGTIYGILGIFGSDFQLYIRDLNDLIGFNWSTVYMVNEQFTTGGSLGTFSQYSVNGGEVWYQSSFSGTTFAKMSGYTSGVYTANEDWLISPSMNLNNYNNDTLKFFTMMNYGTAGDGSLKVYYSTDYVSGDPTVKTWTELTGATLSPGAWANTPSGPIDLSFINGTNVHIAFKYTCSTTNVSTWEVGGIIVKGTPK